jgi:catechol 2,3-dioxygenase-like lactoylglutathione lyase family enzyme
MSYVALATDNFDRMTRFYGQTLAFPVLDRSSPHFVVITRAQARGWDRSRGRGRRFDLGKGLKLELLDNQREAKPLLISCLGDRLHIVVEVIDIYRARAGLFHSIAGCTEGLVGCIAFSDQRSRRYAHNLP